MVFSLWLLLPRAGVSGAFKALDVACTPVDNWFFTLFFEGGRSKCVIMQ